MAANGPGDPARLTRRQLAVAVALHLALAFALFHSAWADPTHLVAGPARVDGPGYGGGGIPNGDTLQLVWFMRWTPFAVAHLHDPLLTTYMNAPHGANLMWDALMPLVGLVVSPVTVLAGPVVAFNLLATLGLALPGLAATACARRFTARFAAALVGGTAFQLSAFLAVQSQGHQSIVIAAALVPALILLLVDVAHQRRSVLAGGLLLGLAAAATLYTWEETLLATALMGLLGAAAAVMVAPRAFRRSWAGPARSVAIGAAVGAVLAAPGLIIQFAGPAHLTGLAIRDPSVWVIDLQNIVVPTSSQLLAPAGAVTATHAWSGDSFEWGGYLGIPLLLVIAGVAATLWRRAGVRWLCVLLVVGTVLSLGPSLRVGGHDTHVPLPWALLAHAPLLADILAARLAVFAALASSLLLAIAVDALTLKGRVELAGLAALAVGLTLVPAPLPAQAVTVPAFFSSTGAVTRLSPGADILVAPYATPLAPEPLIWQAASDMRFRMPEGYVSISGPTGTYLESPPETVTSAAMEAVEAGRTVTVDPTLRQAILADLRRWSAHAVVVGPMPHEGAMDALFSSVIGRPPARSGGVAVWWNV